MVPRRSQTPIAFRSDRAAARLKRLTRFGRSQAEVIEEALDRLPDPDVPGGLTGDAAALYQRVMAIAGSIPSGTFPTITEFDALEYDEFGDPR